MAVMIERITARASVALKKQITAFRASAPKLLRAGKSMFPVSGAIGITAAAYFSCLEVQVFMDDCVTAFGQRNTDMLAAAACSCAADYTAQRYEGKPLDYWRLAGMTAFGTAFASYLNREFYDFQEYLFPKGDPNATIKRILVDQGNWSPLVTPLYISGALLISAHNDQSRLSGFFGKVWALSLPATVIGWGYWGVIALPVIYHLPGNLQVMAASLFGYLWSSFLSKQANAMQTVS